MTRTDPYATISTRQTPQTQPASSSQVANSAGGYTFTLNDDARLRRFLTLGSEGSTYYTTARDLTLENAAVVIRMAETDPAALVNTIVEISQAGRAPKQNPCLFALAIAAAKSDDAGRRHALAMLPMVARTGTHLFIFARYVQQFRGWGRSLRRAVGNWYLDKNADALAYQCVKYRQREGWSHRDLLRKSHPESIDPGTRAVFDWITSNTAPYGDTPALIHAFIAANEPGADVPGLIREHGLSWEMLPDEALGKPATWEALLDRGMPQTALMRQLPRLTRLGILSPMSPRTAEVAARLSDTERLTKARVHPVNVLVAQRTYASGRSARGESTWAPSRPIVDALDAAFYAAFGAVEPAGKRTLIGLDVSGSMGFSAISNMPLSPREASAALCLVTAATEPTHAIVGFTGPGQVTRLSISPRQRLDDVIRSVSNLPFGRTDCSMPMLYAEQQGIEVDSFLVYTDNETYAGYMHPHQALVRYREKTGIDAKLVVVGMTATDFTIADPNDAGMMDVAGFDSAVPNLIADFSRGL